MRVACRAVQILYLVMVEPMKDQPLRPQRVWREQGQVPAGPLPSRAVPRSRWPL